MIASVKLIAAIWLLANKEAWEPVVFGGMIPILGALGVVWLIRYAVKEPPEESEGKKEDGPGDPDPPPS